MIPGHPGLAVGPNAKIRRAIRNRVFAWPAFVCLCAVLWAGYPAMAGPVDGQVFKDWVIHCGKAAEASPIQPCVMSQQIVQKDSNKRVMQIVVGITKQEKKAVAVVTVPLGVRLQPGLRIVIDKGEPLRIPYHQCIPGGCLGQLLLNDKLEKTLRAGLQGTVSFVGAAGREITVKISLSGFTAALNSLRSSP